DHLGSIVGITDEEGNLLEELSYDAWGNRRNPTDGSFTSVPMSNILARGFTGHEHIDEFGLINMNGRIYDPVLGKFLSPDNYVQAPDYTQSLNRYSYAMNNPLMYTDPSGETIPWWGVAIGVAILLGYEYQQGVKANEGELNPFKWDWGKANYTAGVQTGGGNTNIYGGVSWNPEFSLNAGYNTSTGNPTFGYTQQGNTYMTEPGQEEPNIPAIPTVNRPEYYDDRYYHGSEEEAIDLLILRSKIEYSELIMYNTSRGYYYDKTSGYGFYLGEEYNKVWGYYENDIHSSYYYTNFEKQGNYVYLQPSIMLDKVRILSVSHPHPGGIGPSSGDLYNQGYFGTDWYIWAWKGGGYKIDRYGNVTIIGNPRAEWMLPGVNISY
ncbi:MAG: RHS repeat-associated core domain-containing protein, partial [Bacteroidia bacterium]|nr:RHS repeat-associated core domain-containing protein [Bacteroidia bacterium]